MIYIQKDGQQNGPFNQLEVLNGICDQKFAPDDLAWREGMAGWQPLHTLLQGNSQAPPPMPARKLGDDLGMRMLLPVGRSGWAIAAGYLGLFGLLVVPTPLALITGILAVRDIKKSAGTANPKHGMGRAIFGLVVGVLGTVALLIFMTRQMMHR